MEGQEEFSTGKAQRLTLTQAVFAAVKQKGLALRIFFLEGPETAHVGRADTSIVLRLDAPYAVLPIDHKVELYALAGPPERKVSLSFRIGDPCLEVLADQPLEGLSFDLFRTIKRSLRSQGPEDAGIQQEELWVAGELPFCLLGEGRNPPAQEDVTKNINIPPTTFRSTPHSRDTLLIVRIEACEKLMASRNLKKLPMLRTSPSACTSSRR